MRLMTLITTETMEIQETDEDDGELDMVIEMKSEEEP